MEALTLRLAGDEATRALGERLAEVVGPGDFLGLSGDLGTGKTTLSRALCEALGVPREQIASPTYSIFHPYTGGRLPVLHADLYRLADEDELVATGFFELLDGATLVLVEWIDRIPEAAPASWLHVELRHVDEAHREARIVGHGPRGLALVDALR